MAIGENTLHTATLEVKLVTRTTTTTIMKSTIGLGNGFNICIDSPSLAFNPEVLAALDSANPPPTIGILND